MLKHKISALMSGKQGKKSYEIDMVNGSLLGKMLRFALPLMLSGILQLFFNAADVVVVGQFAGPTALAAVGSTGALINLIVNLFIGLSVGTNVLVARYYGAQQQKDLSETVHTSILTSIVSGFILVVIGVAFADPLLRLMGCPEDVLPQAALYMRVFFCGMPAMMLYNFGAAVLRSVGDTKRPLYFLLFAGIINVILNLVMVIVFHLGVAGVAIATVVSNIISAGLVFICLMKAEGPYRMEIKKLRIHKDKLIAMTKIGLPAGMQGCVFSFSNVVIQSSINSFGSIAMAGSTAAGSIENFVYTAMNSFHQAALSFTGQNIGARKYSRVNRILLLSLACVTVTGLILGVSAWLFGSNLLGIYTGDPEAISYGLVRMIYVCLPYFICGVMDVMVGSLRGLGYSVMPMIVSLAGACGLRLIWIFTIFQEYHTFEVLFLSYPISWAVTALAHIVCFLIIRRKFPKTDGGIEIAAAESRL